MSDSGGGIFGGLLNPDPSALYTGLLSDPATKQALANRQLQAMAGAYGEMAMPRPVRVPIGAVLGAGAAAAGNVMDTTMKSRLEAMQALQAQYQAQVLGQNVDFMKRAMDPNDPLHKIAFPDYTGAPTPPVATPSETGEPVKLGTGDTAGAQSILSGPLGDKVRYWASYHNVPADLYASLVWQESHGNPKAVSPAGAQGLAQIMPGTQEKLGITNPFDVDQSLSGGAKYLRQGLDAFNGDLTKALKYYHSGSTKESEWGPKTNAYAPAVLAGTPVPPPQTATAAPTPLVPAPPGPPLTANAVSGAPTPPAVPPVATAAPQRPGRVSIPGGPITAAERTAWVNSRVNGGQDTIEDWVAKARGQTSPAPVATPVPQISPPGTAPPPTGVAAGLPPGSGGGMPPVLPPGAGEIGAGGDAGAPAVPPVAAGGGGAPALPGYLMPTPGSAKPLAPLVTPPGPAAATPPVAAAPGVVQPMTPQQVQATINAAQFWAMAGRPEYGKALLENPAFKAAQEAASKAAALPYTPQITREGGTISMMGADGKMHVVYQNPKGLEVVNQATGQMEQAQVTYGPNGPVIMNSGVVVKQSPAEEAAGRARGEAAGKYTGYAPGNPLPPIPGQQGPAVPGGIDPAVNIPVTHTNAPGDVDVKTTIPAVSQQPPMDAGTYAAKQETWNKQSADLAEAGRTAALAEQRLHTMADAFKIIKSGWGATEQAEVAAIMKRLNIPAPANFADPAAVQYVLHSNIRATLENLKATTARFTGGEFKTTSESSYNPDLQPEANHAMIAEDIAKLRQLEYLSNDWARAQSNVATNGAHWVNPEAFKQRWLDANPVQTMTRQAEQDIGPFRGMPGFQEPFAHDPKTGITYRRNRAGQYIGPDGRPYGQ